jgi:type I restriction enzyme S subunit
MNKKPLTKVAKIIAGQSPPSTTYNHTGDGLPFFQGKADFQERSPRVRMWCNSERRKEALPGDVLISVRAPVGAVNLCDQTSIIGRGLSAIRPTDELHGEYLFHFLRCHERQIASLGTGSTFQAITQDTLGKIEIPLPPLDDQKRIAHLLSKVEGLIAQRKEHLRQLDDLLKSVFLTMFGDPVRNEKGWEPATLDQFCERIIDCPHSTPTYSDEPTGNYCVRSSDIVSGFLDLQKTFQVDAEVFAERIRRYEPQLGDIVYSREGGRLGNAARIIDSAKVCLGQRMMLFKTKKDNHSEFLWALLESAPFKAKLQGLVGGGAAPRVNIKDLIKLLVIRPPQPLQSKFADVVQKLDRVRSRYQLSLIHLECFFAVLSRYAFNSELNLLRIAVPQTNDEVNVDTPPQHKEDVAATSTFELPTPAGVCTLANTKGRQSVLQQWLDVYASHVGKQSFSADAFINLAQKKLTELQSLDDAQNYDYEFSAADYDHVKDWIFRNLESHSLKQDYDDANNRVQISLSKD